MPHPSFVTPTHIRTEDVLGILLDEPEVDTAGKSPIANDNPRSDSWDGKATPSAADLDLSNVPEAYRAPLRKMLLRYDCMWDGRLGEINVVKYRIDLKPGARPHMKRPFRTGPSSRKFVSEEV